MEMRSRRVRNQRRVLVAVVVAGISAILVAGVAYGSFGSGKSAEYLPLPPSSEAAGVLLEPHGGQLAKRVSQSDAEAAARSWLGTESGPTAHVGQISFGDFTDRSVRSVDSAVGPIELQAQPSYVVTFVDMSIPGRGLGSRVNHEMSVVIDASSGAYLEAFTVR
jgi:hypothetical protein